MDYSNTFLIILRRYTKKIFPLRFIRFVQKILYKKNYEDNFDKKMLETLKKDYVVFDIGANIGFYTEKFAKKVGSKGKVFAFEPVSESASKIKDLQKKYPYINLDQFVVGDQNCMVPFDINRVDVAEENTNEYFSSMVSLEKKDSKAIKVQMHTLDFLTRRYGCPDFIKIDVEGFELNVLLGAEKVLSSNHLKHIFIEIHFSILEKRGEIFGPKKINNLLKNFGFKIKYIDPSHIYAFRK